MSLLTKPRLSAIARGRLRRHCTVLASQLVLIAVAVAPGSAQTATPTPTQTSIPTPTATPVPTFDALTCFSVPDSIDSLVAGDATTGAETIIGPTGAPGTIRGLAIPPVGDTLYAATASELGTVDPTTGVYSGVGSFGTAINGAIGPIELDGLVALTFNSSSGVLFGVHRTTLDPDTCFAVEDTGDTFVTIDRLAGSDAAVGATSNGVEALAAIGSTLYAAIGDQLGVIDRANGAFSPRSATFGQGDPGPVDFDDIRGLAFDSANRILYASNREPGGDDQLFVVNLTNGAHVPLQFAAGTADFVSISGGSCVSPVDIEALAMDPTGTTLFGSNGTDLVVVSTVTGTCNIVGAFGGFGPPVTITGLGFDDGGTLYGTDATTFYSIDTGTGLASPVGGGLGVGSDYRAMDCPITQPDALFRIDPASGSYVPLHFDFETSDYALIDGGTCGTEIEAVAYDQQNDIFLGVDGTNDRLVDIDPTDGFCFQSTVNPLGVADIVSMTYAQGTNQVLAAGTSTLYAVDPISGIATPVAALGAGTNYEALECPTQGCPLVVRKRHVGIPYAGAEINYRLFWLNPCEGITFTNVILTDPLPAGLELVSATSTAATVQTSGDTVTLTDALLPKGPAQFGSLRARITAAAGSRVRNTITLRDDYGREFSATDTIKVREPRSQGSLALHAQAKSAPGKTVTYTARYKQIAASNDLVLTLPAEVEIVAVYPDAASVVGNVVAWSNLPASAGGVRVRTRVSESLTTSTVLTAVATLSDAAGADLQSSRDTIVTFIAPRPTPDTATASVSIAAPKQVVAGLVTTFSIKYRDVQGTASVEVVLPPELSPTQTTPAAQISGNTLTWPGLGAGAGGFKVKALVAAEAAPGSILTVTAAIADSGSGTANESAQVVVRD